MQLLDHVSIAVNDLDRARPFYDAVLAALDCAKVYDRPQALGYGQRCGPDDGDHTFLAVYQATDCSANDKRHWCFKAASRAAVDAFHRAALAHGGVCDGAPGLRPHYHAAYYAAFVKDPEGHRLEAVCHASGE